MTLTLVPTQPSPPEPAYRTIQKLPKATCGPDDGSDEGPWITKPFILERTPEGLSDRPAEERDE